MKNLGTPFRRNFTKKNKADKKKHDMQEDALLSTHVYIHTCPGVESEKTQKGAFARHGMFGSSSLLNWCAKILMKLH